MAPTPGENYTLEMVYRSNLSGLSSSNATNWLIEFAPDLYLYGALLESAAYMEDDARLAKWGAAFTSVLDQLIVDDLRLAALAVGLEQDEDPLAHQRQGQIELLPGPGGELPCRCRLIIGEAQPAQQPGAVPLCLCRTQAQTGAYIAEVLLGRQVVDQTGLLRAVGEPGNPCHHPPVGSQHTCADSKERRLSRPVLAHHRKRLTSVQLEGDSRQNLAPLE